MELTRSHGVEEVLPEIARRLNLVLLKRVEGDRFELLEEPPEWFRLIFAPGESPNQVHVGSSSLFLDGFLTDAEDHWANERPEPLKSGVWHEFDKGDREHYLEATAVYVRSHAVLILESLGHDYEVRVQLFQKARNFVLQNQTLDYELQKNDVLLHFLSTHLAPALQRIGRSLGELKQKHKLDHAAMTDLNEVTRLAARQDMLVDTFLRGFSSEIVTMQQVSRDYGSAPDVIEVVRTLVKAELDAFLNRSVGLSMESTVPPSQSTKVVSHRARLDKVIGSLMHFALRRAPEGSAINIQIHSHGEDWIHVEMHESVASLSHEDEEIFENLLSVNSLVRKTALSLYFCKLTIERWGGEIGYRHMGESGCWWFRLRRVKKPG